MNKLEKVNQLISYLLEASPEYLPYCEQHPKNYTHRRVLLRGLMNIRNLEKGLLLPFMNFKMIFYLWRIKKKVLFLPFIPLLASSCVKNALKL